MDLYRKTSRGKYDTDFSFMKSGNTIFPSKEVRQRNSVYRFRFKEFNGSYSENKQLIAMVDGVETEINYKTLSTNYFKLLTNKMSDLIFNNDITIKTGDIKRDKEIYALVDRTGWINEIRKAFKKATIYGDSCIKTYAGGVSAFNPLNCFKIVDAHDINKTLAYCLYEYLYTETGGVRYLTHIRFEIHFKGKIFEQVKLYSGNYRSGSIGKAVDYKYRGRDISKEGNWYDTGVDDCELIQWLTVNQEADGVYGESLYADIQDLVFALEQRLSSEYYSLNNLQNPFLVIGASAIQTDQRTGERSVKLINNKILVQKEGDGVKPEFVTPEYKLESSEQFIETVRDLIYELSELSKSYLSGQYSGNPSEESINNLIKSAIDKGNRLITEMYYAFRDSLYVLCRLNGINITKEEINIGFNVGRTDDDMKIIEICEKAVNNKILSKATVREKYFGYNKEQSDAEDVQIEIENNSVNQQENINDNNFEQTSNNEENLKDKEIKEDKQNEVE